MGAQSLLLRAEQRETIHDDIAWAPRYLVVFGLLYVPVVKPEENIYCASRSLGRGRGHGKDRLEGRAPHNNHTRLFFRSERGSQFLEWANNHFNKVTKY